MANDGVGSVGMQLVLPILASFLIGIPSFATEQTAWHLLMRSAQNSARQDNFADAERSFLKALVLAGQSTNSEWRVHITRQQLAELYIAHDKTAAAESLLRQNLKEMQLFGEYYHEQVPSLLQLAAVLQTQKRYAQSQSLFARSLAIEQRFSGRNSLETAHILEESSKNLLELAQLDEARQQIKDAMSIRRNHKNRTQQDPVVRDLTTLALIEAQAGRLSEAQKLFASAAPILWQDLRAHEKRFGPDSPAATARMKYLAYTYAKLDEPEKAELLYQRVLNYQLSRPTSENQLAITYSGLGNALCAEGKYKQAEKILSISLSKHEHLVGTDTLSIIPHLRALANVYIDEHCYSSAEQLLHRIIAILGRTAASTTAVDQVKLDLAELYIQAGRLQAAVSLLSELTQEGHATNSMTLEHRAHLFELLAAAQSQLGQRPQARSSYDVAVQLRQQSSTPDSCEKLARDLVSLSALEIQSGHSEAAKQLLARAFPMLLKQLSFCEQRFGANSGKTASALQYLAQTYAHNGEPEKAQYYYKRMLTIPLMQQPQKKLTLATIYSSLGHTFCAQQNYSEAQNMFERSLPLYEQLQYEGPALVPHLLELANVYIHLKKYGKAIALYDRSLQLCENSSERLPDCFHSLYNYPKALLTVHQAMQAKHVQARIDKLEKAGSHTEHE